MSDIERFTKLFDGDASVNTKFEKCTYAEDGRHFSASFDAPEGHEFVILLLGTVPKGEDPDLVGMLDDLGFVPKPADEATDDAAE